MAGTGEGSEGQYGPAVQAARYLGFGGCIRVW